MSMQKVLVFVVSTALKNSGKAGDIEVKELPGLDEALKDGFKIKEILFHNSSAPNLSVLVTITLEKPRSNSGASLPI